MKPDTIKFAAEVIRQSKLDKPADGVLREMLKAAGDTLSGGQRRKIARTVFTYYRWKGWLTQKAPVESKLHYALELADRYRENPVTLNKDILRAKAVPEWVWDEIPMSDDWLRVLQREPKLWLRARPGKARELFRTLGECSTAKHSLMTDALEYSGLQDLYTTEAFAAGAFEMQDIASQAVGVLCAPQPGETWWDACAGEGGKTLHLADLMQGRGQVFASDRAEWRLAKLKQRAARAGVQNYQAAVWDGGSSENDVELPFAGPFDGVLVDAPCSGTGTWQRNPHARWTLRPDDVLELAKLQKNILLNVAPTVKPGGKLIYAVCTLTRTECDDVVKFFNETHPDFEPLPLPNPSTDELQMAANPPAPQRHIWPQDFDGNGMFVAAWRKKK